MQKYPQYANQNFGPAFQRIVRVAEAGRTDGLLSRVRLEVCGLLRAQFPQVSRPEGPLVPAR
jgi:hypothetical protein